MSPAHVLQFIVSLLNWQVSSFCLAEGQVIII